MGGIHGKIVSIDGNEGTLDVDRGTKIKFDLFRILNLKLNVLSGRYNWRYWVWKNYCI